jgi:hypothetical protein
MRCRHRAVVGAWYDDGMTAAKIAVTVPRETFVAVEKRRRQLGVTRSAVVTAALQAWLADQSTTAEERRYLLAYLREPETVDDLRDAAAIARVTVGAWDPWDAPRQKRSRPRTRSKR